MKSVQKILNREDIYTECCHIPHVIYLADFNTSHPASSRIDRIASEINEYLRRKNRNNMGK